MVKLYFRKILEYDPTFSGKLSRFNGYNLITSQKRDPSILDMQNYELSIPKNVSLKIIASSMKRAIETAYKYFNNSEVTVLDELREIKFELNSLLTEDEYHKGGSSLVRQRFIEAFILDSLSEKRHEIQTRMDSLIKKFLSQEFENYLIVSHSFFMKIFQIYLINQNLFDEPTLIKEYFDPNINTYKFGEGFDFIFQTEDSKNTLN